MFSPPPPFSVPPQRHLLFPLPPAPSLISVGRHFRPPFSSHPTSLPPVSSPTRRHFRPPHKMAALALLRCLGSGRVPRASGPVRPYRAAPLRRRVRPPPLTDPEDQRAAAKRFGWLGAASGVAVERLWPSPERLREMEEEEREWCPSLREMEAALERKEQEERRLREERWGGGRERGEGNWHRAKRGGSALGWGSLPGVGMTTTGWEGENREGEAPGARGGSRA